MGVASCVATGAWINLKLRNDKPHKWGLRIVLLQGNVWKWGLRVVLQQERGII